MKTILVFGGNSQLAKCIKKLEANFPQFNIVFFSSSEADISNLQILESTFQCYRPDIVINCAAYTAVDLAESEKDRANLINAQSPLLLANTCKKNKALLIHISTDFVFEGNKAFPLKETDETAPLNVYGQSKLEGEKGIIENTDRYIILRTSWLYSEYGHNFVKTMLKLGKERESLGVVVDQIGTPTYAMDLANVILEISDSNKHSYGLYHYSNEGVASWFDFAHAIFKFAKLNVAVLPLSTAQFPTKAVRPAFSVMDKSKIKDTFHLKIPYWQDSLENCLKIIVKTEVN